MEKILEKEQQELEQQEFVNEAFGFIFDGRILPIYIVKEEDTVNGEKVFEGIVDKHIIRLPVLETELKTLKLPILEVEKFKKKASKWAKGIKENNGKCDQFSVEEELCITKGLLTGYRCKVITDTYEGITVIEMYNRDMQLLRTGIVQKNILKPILI